MEQTRKVNWAVMAAIVVGPIPGAAWMFFVLPPVQALVGTVLIAAGFLFSFVLFAKTAGNAAAETDRFLSELKTKLSHINDRTEEMTMNAISILTQIVKKSKEGSEEAESVVEYFIGGGAEKASFGESFVTTMLSRNEVAVSTAGNVFREVSRTNQVFLDELKKITANVEEVYKFVAEIQKVALQTKILSLNAAVEAARAGEHGQGFSVVSDHVRRLANQSGEMAEGITAAARQARSILNDLEKRMDKWVAQGNEQMEAAEGNLRETLDKFKASIDNVSEAVGVLTMNYQSIAKEIENATITLQFQDITGQELSHVKNSLVGAQALLRGVTGFFFRNEKAAPSPAPSRSFGNNDRSGQAGHSPPQMEKPITLSETKPEKEEEDDDVTFF